MSNRLVKRVTLGLTSPIWVMLLVLGLSFPAYSQSQPQVDLTGKNVLILHSLEGSAPVFVETDKGLITTLESGGIPRVNQFFETLDLRRNPGSQHRRLLVEQMRVRYGHRKLNMIITMYPEALEFVLKDSRDIFANVPILALYLPPGMELPKTDRNIIGHTSSIDIIGTFEIALKLVPGAKRVYVVSGTHPVDRGREDNARRHLKKWEGRLEFRYLSSMSFEDILTALSTAPPETIILLLTFGQDIAGRAYTAQNMTERLSQVSTAPIFGLLGVGLGHGIAGGSLIDFEHIGTKAGRLVLNFLRSMPQPENIPGVLNVPAVPMFDWRQLRRWNLGVDALPKGSIVINRKLTLWDFKYYIIGGIAILLAQTLLVIGLLIQKHRKNVAKESLRQKTEELDQFFEVALDLLCIANTDGYFLRLNRAAERILGYTREELMAKRFLDFVHPDDLDRSQEAVSALASQQKVTFFENRYGCKDGTYRWLQWSSTPAANLIYSAARDVTERKQVEEDLRRSEERFRLLIETMNEGFGAQNENGVWNYVNDGLCAMLGYFPGDIIGRPVTEFLDEANQSVLMVEIQKQRRGNYSPYEITWTRIDGRKVTTIVSPKPVFNPEGQLKEVFAVIMDITERKRAEAESFQAARELLRLDRLSRMGELTASLAHELNQPLAAILSNAQAGLRFLQSGKMDVDELQEVLRDVIQDDQRAASVIRSLRSMMKREEVERNLIVLNNVLGDVIRIFHTESIFRNIHVETEFDGSLPSVLGDKVQLQQVALNLILNAADAMSDNSPEDRQILLCTGVQADRVRVTVRDSGPGIDKENLERIFDPFFTTKKVGLGMGLSVCRTIVEAHGGHIWAENNPESGATFVFEIPIPGQAASE